MERIEDLMLSSCTAQYHNVWNQQEQQFGTAWLPSLPVPFDTLRARLSDAWAVFTGRATAVQWPHQREAQR